MTQQSDDDLLKRARELNERLSGTEFDSALNHQSAYDKAIADSRLLRWLASVSQTFKSQFGPVGALLAFLLRILAKWLNWLCMKPAGGGVSGGQSGARFSALLLVKNLGLSVVAAILLHMMVKALYFYTTYFEETVYITGKQEITTGELYQLGGCTSLPCSTESDNGKFYLIESSLYFPIMFYPEENVFANVPQQDAACHVEGYGIYFRSLRWLYKSLQFYQHVVDVSCRPYTDLEIRKAVGDGLINVGGPF